MAYPHFVRACIVLKARLRHVGTAHRAESASSTRQRRVALAALMDKNKPVTLGQQIFGQYDDRSYACQCQNHCHDKEFEFGASFFNDVHDNSNDSILAP